MDVDVAPGKAIVDLGQVGRGVEQVFSGFQRAAAMEVVPDQKTGAAANHSSGLKFSGDSARAESRT